MKRNRSPLHGASRRDLAALRALVTSHLEWESKLGTPGQILHADEPISAITQLSFYVVDRARARSTRRWKAMPHYEESRAVYEDQHLRRFNRAAWEQKQLRTEVGALRAELTELKETIG